MHKLFPRSFRGWLIRKLAGDDAIVINCQVVTDGYGLEIRPHTSGKLFMYAVAVDCHGEKPAAEELFTHTQPVPVEPQ